MDTVQDDRDGIGCTGIICYMLIFLFFFPQQSLHFMRNRDLSLLFVRSYPTRDPSLVFVIMQ